MNKKQVISTAVAFAISLGGCSTQGSTFGMETTIGASQEFTREEIEEAMETAKETFKSFDDCDLIELTYQEQRSRSARKEYLREGKESMKGIEEEDVLVLLLKFKVGDRGINKSFKSETIYTNYRFIMVRDKSTQEWRTDGWRQ